MVYRLLRGPYLDPDTGVLHNRRGITDAEELERIKRQRASIAATWLLAELRPTRWGPALLRFLHQQLFGQRTRHRPQPSPTAPYNPSPFSPALYIHQADDDVLVVVGGDNVVALHVCEEIGRHRGHRCRRSSRD